ncbi:sarcosine oxidase subunit delta [Ruegeria sp.]|uniref:sarcosine oxidase subunit delta n=1 Tax=Ruegeria sp. TaxID=1879320 RepID=UPI003C7D8DBA
MRITCPFCGERDRREFYYRGAAVDLDRPAPDAGADVWGDFVHLRDNPAGPVRELWYHEGGCGAWIVVTRDTVTHEVLGSQLASEVSA